MGQRTAECYVIHAARAYARAAEKFELGQPNSAPVAPALERFPMSYECACVRACACAYVRVRVFAGEKSEGRSDGGMHACDVCIAGPMAQRTIECYVIHASGNIFS